MNRSRAVSVFCALALVLACSVAGFAQSDEDSFKGGYVGFFAGGAIGRSHTTTTTVFSPTGYFATSSVPAIAAAANQRPDPSGATAGGGLGYNWQHGKLVFGLETDFSWLGVDETKTATAVYPCCAPTSFTISQRMKADWLLTMRPRFGFTFGKALVYGTAGVAFSNPSDKVKFTDTFATAAESQTVASNHAGWTAGGGVEFKVHHHWAAKGEYLYTDFGDDHKTSTNLTAFTPPISFPTNVFTHRADLQLHIYRVGLNYHF